MTIRNPSLPQSVRSAISELWRTSLPTEDSALASRAFDLLERNCRDTYSAISGSRIHEVSDSNTEPRALRSALRNFFRWNSAPWHCEHRPNADDTAVNLHRAFLSSTVNRTYFAPLDRLCLLRYSVRLSEKLTSVRFGPNEIVLLTSEELSHRIPCEALSRFGPRHEFPLKQLDDRYWLVVTVQEDAGPIWKRNWHQIWYERLDDFDKIPVFESTYPAQVEDALFVLLLGFVKELDDIFWRPFVIPWVYSFTEDPFADPPRSPDSSVLSTTFVGEPGEEFEVSDQSERFSLTGDDLIALEKRWSKLQTVSAKTDAEGKNFHPLTRYFFVKAFVDQGIDEIIASISCIEATLQLKGEFNTRELMKRYKFLVNDDEARQWLKKAYTIRKEYLHSLGTPTDMITFEDLARTRASLVKAVDAYLHLASQRRDLDRDTLLKLLATNSAIRRG